MYDFLPVLRFRFFFLLTFLIIGTHIVLISITRQITNLEKKKTIIMKIQSHYSPLEVIVKISKRQITTPEKSVLNKVLNFATTIKRIPYFDLIAPIKDTALKNSQGKSWWTKMKSETSTWELKASETKHLKKGETVSQIATR